MPLSAWREPRGCEAPAHYAKKEMPFTDVIAGLVCPFAVWIFVPSR
jgi:hypothetical protein